MAALSTKRADDIVLVALLSRIVGFGHRRISRDGRHGSVPRPVTRHGEHGRPRTEGGRTCNRCLDSSHNAYRLAVAGEEIVGSLGDFHGLVGLGPEGEQIVSRPRCGAGGANDGAIVVAQDFEPRTDVVSM